MKTNIYIFLKPRLKTLDTLLPLLFYLKNDQNKFFFVIPNINSYEEIEQNVVLNDLVIQLGEKINLNKLNIVNKLFLSLRFLLNLFFKKLKIIIFDKPVGKKKFFILLKKNLYISEGDSYGNSYAIEITKGIEKNTKPNHYYMPNINLILYSDSWYNYKFFNSNNNKSSDIFNIGNPRLLNKWKNYINEKSEYYLSKYIYNKINNDQFITYILGVFEKDFGWDNEKKIMHKLFMETIKAIRHVYPNLPIIFKPYSMTNMNVLEDLIKISNLKNYHISYLHPFVLAKRSKFAISNSCSTVLADFKINNTITLEYSSYSDDLLRLTNFNSIQPQWVNYFINNNYDELTNVLIKINKLNFKNIDNGFSTKAINKEDLRSLERKFS